jgi:hypothetical protein
METTLSVSPDSAGYTNSGAYGHLLSLHYHGPNLKSVASRLHIPRFSVLFLQGSLVPTAEGIPPIFLTRPELRCIIYSYLQG